MLLGLSAHACATKCQKCEEGKEYVLQSFEDVRAVLKCTEREDMAVTQKDHVLYLLHKTLLLSHTHHSQSGLHSIVAAFVLAVFSSVFAPGSLLFLARITIFAILSS